MKRQENLSGKQVFPIGFPAFSPEGKPVRVGGVPPPCPGAGLQKRIAEVTKSCVLSLGMNEGAASSDALSLVEAGQSHAEAQP